MANTLHDVTPYTMEEHVIVTQVLQQYYGLCHLLSLPW